MRLPSFICMLRLRGSGFRDDVRGIAAIEFAMIFPIVIMMFFGLIDLSNGFAVDRKVSIIAQTMSDLASSMRQKKSLAETDITGYLNIADAILTPYDRTKLKATVNQVYLDPATKTAKIAWSRGDEKKTRNAIVAVPADLIAKDSSGNWLADQYLILSEVNYNYVPTVGWVVPKLGVTLSERSFMKPRYAPCVKLISTTDCSTS